MTIVVDGILDALDRRLREAPRGDGQVFELGALQRQLGQAAGSDRLADEIVGSPAGAGCDVPGCVGACD